MSDCPVNHLPSLPSPHLPTDPRLLLRSVFGLDTFRDPQSDVIDHVIQGKHALVIMPTGGGKSLCYQLPALLRTGTALVVSPLIALMKDQVDTLRQLGVSAGCVNSSMTVAENRQTLNEFGRGKLDLLYVAPERVATSSFFQTLETVPLALVAIDEAHCISQWGHDFRPDYLELEQLRVRFPDVPCLAVTATADAPTRREICERLHVPPTNVFVAGFDRPNIRYFVEPKRRSSRKQFLDFVRRHHTGEAGIVYCRTRNRTEELARWLCRAGHRALPYHAGLDHAVRQVHQDQFLREEGLIVVATVAFGMGIDKPNVRFVAHLDMPSSMESYYQETGRAGRDGLPSSAWMVYSLGDWMAIDRRIAASDVGESKKWVERHKLNDMVGYCETPQCRRSTVLGYFGEEYDGPCDNCDNCIAPPDVRDGTVLAQKLLSTVHYTGQRFGASHVVDVLVGKRTEKVHHHGHHLVRTFGLGNELSERQWRSVTRQLVAARLLAVDISGYGALRLTKASLPVLRGVRTIDLRHDLAYKVPQRDKAQKTPDQKNTALFENLRSLRKQIADEQGVPPYVVFGDRTLVAMTELRPHTRAAFAELPGVGAVKLDRYGALFLTAIAEFEERHNRPDDGY